MQFHLIHLRPDPAVVQQIVQSDPSPGPPPSSQSAIGPCPRCSPERHHQQRRARLRPGGRRSRRLLRSSRAERRRARRAAAAVPPAPRCPQHAARRGGGLFAHAEACGFGHRSRHHTPISGSVKYRVLTCAKGRCECCGAGCCSANPASKGPGGCPHRAQEPWRLGRPQQPAGPLLPLQRCQAIGGARREHIAERMIGAAEHVRNSMLGSGQRTNRDEILITNRSEAAV
jgi:hypothetical protein